MVRFRSRKPFRARSNGSFRVDLPDETRQVILNLAESLEELVALDVPDTKRLFPTAYPDDPERDAGYQIFARDQLVAQRIKAAETIRATVDKTTLTQEEFSTWLGAVNDARLVLGTRLDVSEEDELDLSEPDFELHLLYHQLGVVLHHMVEAIAGTLPDKGFDPDRGPG